MQTFYTTIRIRPHFRRPSSFFEWAFELGIDDDNNIVIQKSIKGQAAQDGDIVCQIAPNTTLGNLDDARAALKTADAIQVKRIKYISLWDDLWAAQHSPWLDIGPINIHLGVGIVPFQSWQQPQILVTFAMLHRLLKAFRSHPVKALIDPDLDDYLKDILVRVHTSFPDIGPYGGFYPKSHLLYKDYIKSYAGKTKWATHVHAKMYMMPSTRVFSHGPIIRALLDIKHHKTMIIAFLALDEQENMPLEMIHMCLLHLM